MGVRAQSLSGRSAIKLIASSKPSSLLSEHVTPAKQNIPHSLACLHILNTSTPIPVRIPQAHRSINKPLINHKSKWHSSSASAAYSTVSSNPSPHYLQSQIPIPIPMRMQPTNPIDSRNPSRQRRRNPKRRPLPSAQYVKFLHTLPLPSRLLCLCISSKKQQKTEQG